MEAVEQRAYREREVPPCPPLATLELAASRAPTAKEKDIIPLVQAFTGTTSQYLRWIHSPQEKLEGCVDFFNGCIVSLDNIQEANGNTSLLAITLKNYHPMFLTALASWVSRLSPSDPFPPPCNCDHQNSLVRLCHINSFLDTPGSRRPTTTVILSKVLLWLGLCFNNLKHYRPASWPKSPQDLMPLGRLKYLRHVEDWLLALPCEEAGVLLSVLSGAAKLETSLVKDIHASETMGRTLLEVGQKLIRKYCTLRHTLALAELGVDGLHFMLQQFDVTTEAFASVLLLLVQKSHDKQLGNFMKGVHNVQALFELCRELVELTWVVVRHADPSGAESRLINGAHYTFLFLTLFFSPTYALPTLDLPSLLSSPPPHPVELSRKARSILVDRITDEFIWNYLLGSLHECYMARHCAFSRCPRRCPIRIEGKCSRCHLFNYCNTHCQRPDWNTHRDACKILAAFAQRGHIDGLLGLPVTDEVVSVFRTRCEQTGFSAAMAKQLLEML